jgi:hypothetical protein
MSSQRSLISPSNTPDLEEIQKKKHEEALKNLITGKTPKEVVYQRPAGGGVQVDYVPGWWFVEQLNALFGYFWDFEITREFIGQEQIWTQGKLTIKKPGETIIETITYPDGRIVKTETRYDPVTVTKTQYGGSKIKSKGNPAIDIGDDLKAAGTDSLKKSATLLGLAADIYGNREILEQTSVNRSQLDSLYRLGTKMGMTSVQVEDWVERKHPGKDVKDFTVVEVLGLINTLRAEPPKKP